MSDSNRSVKLTVRTPCLSDDRSMDAHLDWTVLQLKIEIQKSWPNHPPPGDQRLVYAGKLLDNNSVLGNLLRLSQGLKSHTLHLVLKDVSHYRPPSIKKCQIESEKPSGSDTEEPAQNNVIHPSASDHLSSWLNYLSSQTRGASNLDLTRNYGQDETSMMQGMYYTYYMRHYMQYVQYHQMQQWQSAHSADGVNGEGGRSNYNSDGNQVAMANALFLDPRVQMLHGIQEQHLNPAAVAAAAAAAVVGGNHPATAPSGHQTSPPNNQPQHEVGPAGGGAAAAGANNNPAMNPVINAGAAAGGIGAMEEDEEDAENGGQRDVLDWLYVVSRVLILVSIIYFYSSLARFSLVAGLFTVIYLYRAGYLGGQQQLHQQVGPVDAVRRQDEGDNEGQNAAAADGFDPEERRQLRNGASVGEERRSDMQARPIDTGSTPVWYEVFVSAMTSFFTSLIPNEPHFAQD